MASFPTRPADITIERSRGQVTIVWADGHSSVFALSWLRANCPCATCREERRAATANTDELKLSGDLPPSAEIATAEFVGNYAIRFVWQDGHDTGIYPFAGLRDSCPCPDCNPDGPPPLLPD